MSLFQCQHCGCKENTATSNQGCDGFTVDWYDWAGIEERKGKKLCSVCAPVKFIDGKDTGFGIWHCLFKRVFLPIGMFKTNREGNLEHIETGDTNTSAYAIEAPQNSVVANPPTGEHSS